MKKSMAIALAACMVMAMTGSVMAAPVNITGDFRVQGRSADDGVTFNGTDVAGDMKSSYWQMRSRVNFEVPADSNTTFFGRFTSRNNLGGSQEQSSTGTGQFDQYGVKLALGDWSATIGRQAVNLGQGALISTGFDAAGIDNKFDGIAASTKSGQFDLNFIGGKTNNDATLWTHTSASAANWAGTESAEWYGMDAATKIDDKLSVGAAVAHRKGATTEGVNSWALNATVTPTSNLTFNGEYAKSDKDNLNKAFSLAGTYNWDKDSFGVRYHKVDKNAVDNINSGLGYGNYAFRGAGLGLGDSYKGLTYTYTHQMNKNASFHMIYMDLSAEGAGLGGSDKEIMSGVKWVF